MPTTKQKLAALKEGRELPVDPREMHFSTEVGDIPPTDERAVLRLACAIHRAESDACAISWPAQARAAEFFNARGLGATLDEAVRLEGLCRPGATA